MCLSSNSEKVNACNSSNSPATPLLSCSSGSKGLTGTNLSTGWTVHIDNLTRNSTNNSVTNSGSLFGSNTGSSPNITWLYSGGCSSGAPLTSGSYKVYYINNTTGCTSPPAYFCAAGNGQNALAGSNAITFTSPSNGVYTPATTSIAGTTTAAASLSLYVNGLVTATTTASGSGTFSFSNLTFLTGQQVYITSEKNTGVVGTSYCAAKTSVSTVTCYTTPPLISVGNSNALTTGSAITGTSTEATGTTIRVYTSANTLVATTTVKNDGTWSTGNTGTTPSTYTALASTSYYANAQNGSCGVSTNSLTFATTGATSSARCGSLPATVTENATTISGTLSGTSVANTVVTLYADGTSIGADTTSTSTWGPIAVNTTGNNTIYAGAVLIIGIAEPSKNEIVCGTSVTVSCTPPTAAIINPSATTISVGQAVTYTLSSSQTGILYSLKDSADALNIGSSKFGSGSSIALITDIFNTAGTYEINVKATSFSGADCNTLARATVTVSSALPVSLLNFEGRYDKGVAKLQWNTSSEQNLDFFEVQKSASANNFKKQATIKATGNSQINQVYTYNDSSISSGVVYYRLKMTDKDNSTARYSKVISLHVNKGIVLNYISPNPFVNSIKINLDMVKDALLQITLNDMTGRKIKTMVYAAKSGLNDITLTGLNSVIKGTYSIELSCGGETFSRQLIIKQ